MKTQRLWVLVVVCLLTFSVLDQFATAYMVGADPRACPDGGVLIRARADTQVYPYVDLQNHLIQTQLSFSAVPQRPRPWDKVKEVPIGSVAPNWQLKTAEGETIALADLRGQVVVLDFWANWCGPCRKLEPLFDQLVREYQSRPVKFFTLSVWPSEDFNPQAYLKEHKLASTFLLGDNAVAKEYGLWGLPTYFVIDPAGKLSYIHVLLSVNAEALGKRLREAIEKVLPKEQDAQSFFH